MNIKSIFAVAFMATALVGTTFSFASCEDDEKPETTQGVEVNGTYNTTLNVGAGTGSQIMTLASVKDQKVVVVSLNGNNTTLTISNYEADLPAGFPYYKHIAQKQYMLKNVKATKLADGTVKLTGQEEVTMSLRIVKPTEEKANVAYTDYKVTVTTEGTIKNGKLNLTNSFTPGKMPFPVVYTYAGQK